MSDIIQLLPDHVANQIAAGEVVGCRSRGESQGQEEKKTGPRSPASFQHALQIVY